VLAEHPERVAEYLSGKEKIFAFLMGQVMKISQGKAHPEKISTCLKTALEKMKK
jgi:aspartyl-tRNA(Asn)/glutamyl-tRNA(Gln) amidotransferase subunit B